MNRSLLLPREPSLRQVSATVVLAAVPALAAAVVAYGAMPVLLLLAVTYATGWLFETLFARGRGRPRLPGLLSGAVVFTLLLPFDVPLWQAAIAMSFGVVFAREVFGGTGLGFLPMPAVAAAFLLVAYPVAGAETPRLCEVTPWTSVVGAAVLLVRRVAYPSALWVLPTVVFGLLWSLTDSRDVALGTVAFGAVFLVADPTTTPLTTAGRVAMGVVAGVMVVLARTFHPARPDGVVYAVLFAGVVAPLVDYVALRYAAWRRRHPRRTHG